MINSQILGPAKATGEMIVVRGGSGDILALDRADGKVLWSYEVSQPALILRSNSTVSIDSGKHRRRLGRGSFGFIRFI